MSLGLVNYDDSDESENESDTDQQKGSEAVNILQNTGSVPKINLATKTDSVEDETVSNPAKEEETSDYLHLPQSKLSLLNTDIDIKSLITSSKKGGSVKISIPSLNEVEEDNDEPAKKKIKPSQKGSGLFALLPTPKSSLVPQSVVNRNNLSNRKPNTIKQAKPTINQKPPLNKKPAPKPSLISYDDSGDEDESSDSVDFFSLESKNDNITPAPVDIDLTEVQEVAPTVHNRPQKVDTRDEALSFTASFQPGKWPETSTSSSYSYPQQPTSEYPTSDFVSCSTSNLELDREAMQQLCGRRDRLKMTEVNLIDVSGDAMLADSQDWLTKQLTEETVHRPSHKKNDGPTSQQRRKHQITYLAHQAKENELELKNQWANNRMSRKQTQAKYGF